MPAVEIVDVSDVLRPDRYVRLRKDGPVYRLPGDMPVELFFRIVNWETDLEKMEPEAQEIALRELHDEVLALFKYGDPSIDKLPVGLTEVIPVVFAAYQRTPEKETPNGRPTRPSTGGGATRSGRSRKPNRSRS